MQGTEAGVSGGGKDGVMRRQHVDDDTQCRMDATRRVLVGCGDPPDPDQIRDVDAIGGPRVASVRYHARSLCLRSGASKGWFPTARRPMQSAPCSVRIRCLDVASGGQRHSGRSGPPRISVVAVVPPPVGPADSGRGR